MNEQRDERLGDLLARHIPAEPTDPAFTARLWDRIEQTGDVRRGKPAPLWRRRPVLAAAVAAAAVAVVLAVSLFGGESSVNQPVIEPLLKLGGPADASAAEVLTEARLALGKIRTLRARWEYSTASIGLPPAEDLRGLSVDEILDQATVGPLMPSWGPSDGTLTSDGRARWDTDMSRVKVGRKVEGGTWQYWWMPGTTAHGMPPTHVQISDAMAGTSLYYAPEIDYSDEAKGYSNWQAEFAARDRGYASGPPDASLDSLVPFGPSPNAFSALENGTVWESTYMGRPCLTVVAPVKPDLIVHYDVDHPEQSYIYEELMIDEVELTFDKVSHLPVRVASSLRGHTVQLDTITDVRINERVSPSEFAYEFREGATVQHQDFGFRDAALGDVESAMGYAPLVPTRLPVGFRLQAVRCARRTMTVIWMGRLKQPSHEVVTRRVTSIGYGKGFLHLTVSLRPAGGLDPLWLAEPFRQDPGLAGATAPPEQVTITSGALAGAQAFISLPPLNVPHLWVVHDGMVVTVAGDVTREQLLRVAGSLEPLVRSD
jgi:hypothetical protein